MLISEKVNNICLIFLGLKGDLLLRLPIIDTIKNKHPHAKVSVVVDKNNLDVVSNHPKIYKVITLDRNKESKYRRMKHMMLNIFELRRQKFDVIINFYGGGSSNFIVRAANSKYRIGFSHTAESRMANNVLIEAPHLPNDHFILYLSHLLQPLGIDPYSVRRGSSFYLDNEGRTFANKTLSEYKDKKLVLYNLATSGKGKTWPVNSFVELSLTLNQLHNIVPVIFTNPGMENLTEEYITLIDNRIPVVHIPRTPFNKEAAIMNECYAVITGDTALMHLAVALKKPTLAIFLGSNPDNVLPEDCMFKICDLRENITSNNINTVTECFTQLNDEI